MYESTTLMILWLLSSLKQECSSLVLIQMLECPAVQVEVALHGLEDDGLIVQQEDVWRLTPDGRERLREQRSGLLFPDTGFPLGEAIAACEAGMPETACEICTRRMRLLCNRMDTAGSAGYLELLLDQLRQWQKRELNDLETRAFTAYAFAAHDAALYFTKNVAQSSVHMKKATEYASAAGDKRTLTLLKFAYGYAVFFAETTCFEKAFTAIDSAMTLLRELDDKELYTRSTPFLVLMHFLQGNFQQTLESYEVFQKSTHTPVLPLMESQLVLQASSSAAYLGHFAHAVGMLKSAISTADIAGRTMQGMLYRQHLGVLYAYMRRENDALDLLQSVVARSTISANPKLMLRAFAAMALCHARMGKVETSYELLSNTLQLARRSPSFSFSYNYLWMLELGVLYAGRGYPTLPGIDPEALFAEAETSPSAMMRGHALRLKALLKQQQGESPESLLLLLDKSLAILQEGKTPVECGLTQRRRAAVLHRLGRTDEAEEAEKAACALLNRLGLQATKPAAPSALEEKGRLFDLCCQEIGSISDWETLKEFCCQLSACMRKSFHAERTALFRLVRGELSCPGSCNLSDTEMEGTLFASNRKLIRQHIEREEPFSALWNGFDAVCLPFRLPDGTPWLLYADSAASDSRIPRCLPDELRRIGLFCASELKGALRLVEARNTSAQVRQIHAVTDMAQQEKLELWGKSPSFRHCLERTKVVAATGAAVLLLGETGVGKEVMANFIHRNSGCKGPFVAIHPASIPENLFENELFGHEKGAFTGAVGQKSGLFELADNGTLFIDEVGDIPMNMQIKLLRVLQEHRFMRVGGTKEHHSSFRLITATNRDLLRAVREGSFREDLYYRISVVPIEIPPLRERIEDMEEFVIAFTSHFARRYGKKVPCPDAETFRRLSSYAWPGNFRELRNAVERAVILYTDGPFDLAVGPLHQENRPGEAAEPSLYADSPTLQELQKRYIQYILNKTGGRISGEKGAEQILGMKRSTLYLKLRQYGFRTKTMPENAD